MSNIDFNNLLNPVGSVIHDNSKTNNRGISDRSFEVSDNNPYIGMIETSLESGKYNKDDIGDLYDKAYQWEADRQNWIEQLTVDQALKTEQREYDSPVSQVERYREAGINLDIQSATGKGGIGSGSGSLAGATSPDNAGSIGRTDNYANKYYTLAAIQTAGQFIQQIAGGASTIMDSISQMRNVSSTVRLNDAQAGLVNAQADSIDALLSGNLEAQQLDNTDKYLQNVGKLSSILENGFTDEQGISLLTAAQIPTELHSGYMDSIRQLHNRPEILADWNTNKVAQRYSEAENREYNDAYVSRMVHIIAEQQENQVNTGLYISQMDETLNRMLADSDYIDDMASIQIDTAKTDKQKMQQYMTEVKNYIDSYGDRIQYAADRCKDIDKEIAELEKKRLSRSNKKLTANEKAYLDSITDERFMIKYGAANDMMMFTNALNRFSRKAYLNGIMVNPDGTITTLNGKQKIVQFNQGMFDQVIQGTQSGIQIAKDAFSMVSSIGMLLLGMKGAGGILNNGSRAATQGFGRAAGSYGYKANINTNPYFSIQ